MGHCTSRSKSHLGDKEALFIMILSLLVREVRPLRQVVGGFHPARCNWQYLLGLFIRKKVKVINKWHELFYWHLTSWTTFSYYSSSCRLSFSDSSWCRYERHRLSPFLPFLSCPALLRLSLCILCERIWNLCCSVWEKDAHLQCAGSLAQTLLEMRKVSSGKFAKAEPFEHFPILHLKVNSLLPFQVWKTRIWRWKINILFTYFFGYPKYCLRDFNIRSFLEELEECVGNTLLELSS